MKKDCLVLAWKFLSMLNCIHHSHDTPSESKFDCASQAIFFRRENLSLSINNQSHHHSLPFDEEYLAAAFVLNPDVTSRFLDQSSQTSVFIGPPNEANHRSSMKHAYEGDTSSSSIMSDNSKFRLLFSSKSLDASFRPFSYNKLD